MRKWEIFPKSNNFSELLPNSFFNSQRFPHNFADFLWFLNNTLKYRKAKN